jgi:hypothetical protein
MKTSRRNCRLVFLVEKIVDPSRVLSKYPELAKSSEYVVMLPKAPRRNKLVNFAGRSGRVAESLFFFFLANVLLVVAIARYGSSHALHRIPRRPPNCPTYPCAVPKNGIASHCLRLRLAAAYGA